MRTSMRPRSAGSSRISKLLLPFLTEAAISTREPAQRHRRVRCRRDAQRSGGAAFVVAEGSCGRNRAHRLHASVRCIGWRMSGLGARRSAHGPCRQPPMSMRDWRRCRLSAAPQPRHRLRPASPLAAAGWRGRCGWIGRARRGPRVVRCRRRGLRRACGLGGCGFRCHRCGSGNSGRHRRRGCGGLRFHRRGGWLAWRRLKPRSSASRWYPGRSQPQPRRLRWDQR